MGVCKELHRNIFETAFSLPHPNPPPPPPPPPPKKKIRACSLTKLSVTRYFP